MTPVKRSEAGSPSRRERAQATQRRIVEAAYRLFCERGYTATTFKQIAEAAGVAVQTVYFTFHTKSTLLSRAYDYAVMGHEEPQVPVDQAWYRQMVAAADVVAAIRHLVTGVGEITRRVTPLYLVARGNASGDPEVARVVDFHERWRADGYREMLEILRAKASLCVGLSPERANDLLLLYAGMDNYHQLVDVRGWAYDEWVDWTVSVVADQIFGRHAGARADDAEEPL
ncbi:MAG: TetR/AcrR family transcriptional regulator [Candidatus Limnocylindria bacterium]